MKLIAGLGNPGKIYIDSRHNIGFSVVKSLAKIYKISLKREGATFSLNGKGKIGKENIILAMPITFMNLSGMAIAHLLKKYRTKPDNLLVVCDDLDLEFGRLKLKPSGSSGGHHGIKSIINSLGNAGFARLRVGIGRPYGNTDASEYVLSPFNGKEKEKVKKIIEKASRCCETWITKGTPETMNIFNKRNKHE